MRDDGLQLIDDCLSDEWLDAWAGQIVAQVEDYLAKHAAFEAFLDGRD
jgi:hypothetical protein